MFPLVVTVLNIIYISQCRLRTVSIGGNIPGLKGCGVAGLGVLGLQGCGVRGEAGKPRRLSDQTGLCWNLRSLKLLYGLQRFVEKICGGI